MNTQRNDGGPAFPGGFDWTNNGDRFEYAPNGATVAPGATVRVDHPGMTLRDYFIAHAPAEPQPWFEPKMPEPRPPHDWTNEAGDRHYLNLRAAERECGDNYLDRNAEAIEAWEKARKKARYVQWPSAWADAMLLERGK